MSDANNKNWAAMSQWLQTANAERSRVMVELESLRSRLAEEDRRHTALEQQMQGMQIKLLTLTGGYRGN